jgi:hypothetical protein
MDEERLPKKFKIGYILEEEKRETKNKMERRHTQSYGICDLRWRLGGQTSLEIGCKKMLLYIIE